MAATLQFFGELGRMLGRKLAFKVRLFLIIFGVVFTAMSAPRLAGPLLNPGAYHETVATVRHAGWACGAGGAKMRWCTKAEADAMSAEPQGRRTAFLVLVAYRDAAGASRQAYLHLGQTGLTQAEAQRGRIFSILLGRDDPSLIRLPPHENHGAMTLGIIGVVSLWLGILWRVFTVRPRLLPATA